MRPIRLPEVNFTPGDVVIKGIMPRFASRLRVGDRRKYEDGEGGDGIRKGRHQER